MYYKPAMQLFFLIMIKMINEIHGCDLFMNTAECVKDSFDVL